MPENTVRCSPPRSSVRRSSLSEPSTSAASATRATRRSSFAKSSMPIDAAQRLAPARRWVAGRAVRRLRGRRRGSCRRRLDQRGHRCRVQARRQRLIAGDRAAEQRRCDGAPVAEIACPEMPPPPAPCAAAPAPGSSSAPETDSGPGWRSRALPAARAGSLASAQGLC